MDNFGVVEVASQRRAVAPGWAYVADNSSRNMSAGLVAAMAAAGVNGAVGGGGGGGGVSAGRGGGAAKFPRKRAARSQTGGAAAGSSVALFSHLTSRQEAKLRKELELLDRDGDAAAGGGAGGGRDGAIPIPAKAIKAQNRYTPNVRKILASQKSFANHLDDFNAFNVLHENNSNNNAHGHGHGAGDATGSGREGRGGATAAASGGKGGGGGSTSNSRRPTKKDAKQRGGSAAARRSTSAATPTPADTPMPDAQGAQDVTDNTNTGRDTAKPTPPSSSATTSILLPYTGPRPAPHPLDDDPLLVSGMPPLPTDDELRGLVAGPPLTYAEARAVHSAGERHYPTRVFCEICGYWGRVKCTKCGTPVCALDCLELHREECVTRYGL